MFSVNSPSEVNEDETWQEAPFLSASAVNGKHYEWQLSDGRQWLPIDNDHVIETHYCQPGAKGITINTSHGQVHIDFDELQSLNTPLQVQRLSFLPQNQTEDVGWYFRDDQLWREYGSPGLEPLASSVSSKDVECQFTVNPQGSFSFTVGHTSYTLDFSSMTQTNCSTGLRRNVRRRPKFSSEGLVSTSVPLTASATHLSGSGYKWEFMGDRGVWTEYQKHICSFDSAAIESQYQLNQRGQLHFRINAFTYTLDFLRMCQTNNVAGTRRAVRRTIDSGSQENGSATLPRWQFQDIGGVWRDYSNGQCSITSQDIEFQYQQNPSGTVSHVPEEPAH
ncbi:protein mono-ADP-ribosyltransferase PARP12 isoform 2-T2 [Aulostomus maculatus]